jgi:hypothetical protein
VPGGTSLKSQTPVFSRRLYTLLPFSVILPNPEWILSSKAELLFCFTFLNLREEKKCLLPTEVKIIRTIFFETERDVTVKIPTIEGLLGDKLTAFAPATTGVPFTTKHGNDCYLQVVKQIFDIGQLFNLATDIRSVFRAYDVSFRNENSYKNGKYTRNQALDDTADTAIELCQINLRGGQTFQN